MMQPDELTTVAEQARLATMLPYLREETERALATLVNKTLKALDANTLTPELALYAWMEYRAQYMLLRKVETRVDIGRTTAERLAPKLDR